MNQKTIALKNTFDDRNIEEEKFLKFLLCILVFVIILIILGMILCLD